MTKYILPFAAFFFVSLHSFAQETGRMETDRPDQTESPFITKRHYIQSEIGFNFEKQNGLTSLVHPTALWKYGLNKRFEFRLITEVVSQETPFTIPAGNKYISGLLPVELGGKIALAEEKGILPKTSLIFHIAPPKFASKKFQAQKWAPNFRFTMQNSITDNIGLGYNFGAAWDGFSDTPSWIYTIATGFNLGKRWYNYIELFGSVKTHELPEHNADIGFAYNFCDDVKADISSGVSLTEKQTWYAAIGFSFRIKTH